MIRIDQMRWMRASEIDSFCVTPNLHSHRDDLNQYSRYYVLITLRDGSYTKVHEDVEGNAMSLETAIARARCISYEIPETSEI